MQGCAVRLKDGLTGFIASLAADGTCEVQPWGRQGQADPIPGPRSVVRPQHYGVDSVRCLGHPCVCSLLPRSREWLAGRTAFVVSHRHLLMFPVWAEHLWTVPSITHASESLTCILVHMQPVQMLTVLDAGLCRNSIS